MLTKDRLAVQEPSSSVSHIKRGSRLYRERHPFLIFPQTGSLIERSHGARNFDESDQIFAVNGSDRVDWKVGVKEVLKVKGSYRKQRPIQVNASTQSPI